jgi:hypothetical protein
MAKKKSTPAELDYLFERDIIDEEDYIDFWRQYWRRGDKGREKLISEFINVALETEPPETLAGVLTKNKASAIKQAKMIDGKVVRRNKNGRFSSRGRTFQAVKKGKRK